LYRDGVRISQVNGSCTICLTHQVTVPADLATYRLESSVTQRSMSLSTSVSAAWTFQSQHVVGGDTTQLPLLSVQFKPILNELGQATRGAAFTLPISVQQLDQQGPAQGSTLTLEASFDDGASWNAVTVVRDNDEWLATLQHPQNAEHVSLRAKVTGASANTAEITVVRAYALVD
jgi:hypothetical protein